MSRHTHDSDPASENLVTATWSLSESSKDAISISRGILRAATTDNVQPLALAATEAFGTTIAMAQGTLMVVEKVAGRRDTTAILEFLQAQVGWSAHDSTSHLARSDGGIRFLSLVAALITIRDTFKCAEALDQMLRRTASRNQMLPTLGQLQDLVTALAPKLWKAGFTGRVEGATKLLLGLSQETDLDCPWTESVGGTPGPIQTAELVAVFAKMYRIGEAQADLSDDDAPRIFITATAAHAWIYAFVRWCLGSPPSVVTTDGRTLLGQPTSSRVVLTCSGLSDASDCKMTIEVFHEIGSPGQLWHTSSEAVTMCGGFLNISDYGRVALRFYGIAQGAKYSAVATAVDYVLSTLSAKLLSDVSPEFAQYGVQVIPPSDNVESAYKKYMGCTMTRVAAYSNPRLPVMELPSVKAQVDLVRQHCTCAGCTHEPEGSMLCETLDIERAILQICLDILALGLLDELTHKQAMLDSNSITNGSWPAKTAHLESFLEQPSRPCRIVCSTFYKRALEMFGVADKSSREYPLAGTAGGQLIYLSILNQPRLNGSNVFLISCFAGHLTHRGERYDLVEGSDKVRREFRVLHGRVDQPRNLSDPVTGRLKWLVSRSSRMLRLSAIMGDYTADPTDALRTHDGILYVNECPHDVNAPLEAPEDTSIFVLPAASGLAPRMEGILEVVAVAGNEAQRFFALAATAGTSQVVVRGRACLACCLCVCRRAGYHAIIL